MWLNFLRFKYEVDLIDKNTLNKELYSELYKWFCNPFYLETYLITVGDFIKTMKLCGWEVTVSDVKSFWETEDKVDKDYLVCVCSKLYRDIHQLK